MAVIPFRRRSAADTPKPQADGSISAGTLALVAGALIVIAYARKQSREDAEAARVSELEEQLGAIESREAAAASERRYAAPWPPMRGPWGY